MYMSSSFHQYVGGECAGAVKHPRCVGNTPPVTPDSCFDAATMAFLYFVHSRYDVVQICHGGHKHFNVIVCSLPSPHILLEDHLILCACFIFHQLFHWVDPVMSALSKHTYIYDRGAQWDRKHLQTRELLRHS
jgi:hypothetical protein